MTDEELKFKYSPAELSLVIDRIENDALSNFLRLNLNRFIRRLLKRRNSFEIKGNTGALESKSGFVLAANHSSHLDIFFLLSCLPEKMINDTFAVVADDYFFANDLTAYFSRILVNSLPMVRGAGAYSGIKACRTLLDRGKNLIIFPEGTRSKTGEMQSFRSGIGLLMAGRKEPVIPAYIDGAFKAMKKGSFFPKRSPVKVTIGQPLIFEGYQDESDSWQAIADKVEKAVRGLK